MSSIFEERVDSIQKLHSDTSLKEDGLEFIRKTGVAGWQYVWDWMGLPIIQNPPDIIAFQELVFRVKPQIIIETGIARGGSLALSASMLCLLDVIEGLDPRQSSRRVVGVDIDIRPHNRKALDDHPLRFKMDLIEGSSIDPQIVQQVRDSSKGAQCVLVSLDSNHTHEHVMGELNAYADLVSLGSYCIVFDTVIEDLPANSFPGRSWDVGNNPKTAVCEWLKSHPEFEIDNDIDNKILISVAPNGFLKRVS
tara:strand:- start:2251 stop:3003 length:753 start_codon:yes stop_codon:yes gene_type:complete